jgi:LysM repeat protein
LTATASPSATILPVLTEVILPTPTPILYTVVQGDTLTGIAASHGITLAALMSANPSVQATSLEVGTRLTIPTGSEPTGEPSPVPALLPILQARCWPEATGGQWCFALVQNGFAESVEDISAEFILLTDRGGEAARQTSYAPLDILGAGQAEPLAVHFPAIPGASSQVRIQLLTAIRILPGDTRYLSATVEDTLLRVDQDGLSAQVSGTVRSTSSQTANTVWLLAAAYDAAGEVVGVRRWQSAAPLAAGTSLGFSFQVASVGPGISTVQFLLEARP